MARKPDLNDVLNDLSKNELIRIILQVAEQDDRFKNGLLVKYVQGDSNEQLQSFQKLKDAIVAQYVGRDGIIPYRQTSSFARDMLGLLENAGEAKDCGLAVDIALMVLEEGVEAFQYADDSDGDIGMLAEESLELIQEIVSGLDRQDDSVREYVFERLLAMSSSDIFNGWEDYRIGLLQISAEVAGAEKLKERLREAIERQIVVHSQDEYGKYTVERLQLLSYQLLLDDGSEEEAERFVQEHLQYSAFREIAIENAMDSGDYRRVIQLAEEGERQDERLPGLQSKWKTTRYKAYQKLSLKNEQRQLARELLLEGNYAYYRELESLVEGDQELFYRSILGELKENGNWKARGVYLQLISDKNDLEEMMTYVRSSPAAIEEYAARLATDYREEAEQLYRDQIHSSAGTSAKRKDYQRVCVMIARYGKIFGDASQSAIILQLESQYQGRPAFLDELSRMKS